FILSLVPRFNIDSDTITAQMSKNAPAETSSISTGIIDDFRGKASGGLLAMGWVWALGTAANDMTAMRKAFNVTYDVEASRKCVVSKCLESVCT
ncbi:hypothetical protein DV965_17330, partial [Staphylococcus pseudintermedius]|uniref:YihY/virulence factor BrkB family protein n=1 Tax=Staphylococcus pseudintermedius TaxID=283734 RepID=UPI000E383CF8